MTITNKDIEKLSGVFATKEDLKKATSVFATKEDLRKATSVFVTKEEAKQFATKEDLKGLKAEILNTTLSSQDKIIKKLEDMSIEQKMAFSQYRRQEEKLENHEGRIKVLEDKVSTS